MWRIGESTTVNRVKNQNNKHDTDYRIKGIYISLTKLSKVSKKQIFVNNHDT